MSIWQRIVGGWKTHGPSAISGPGGFDEPSDSPYSAVGDDAAMRLSAVWACQHLRAETMGSLPLHLRNDAKDIIKDHDLYPILHDSPNAMQTSEEFFSQQTARVDMHGNALSIVERAGSGRVISLEPIDPGDNPGLGQKKSGAWFYQVGDEKYDPKNILHFKGFSKDGHWGLPRLDIGRHILSAQIFANDAAMRAFKQSLKVGGFFEVDQNLDKPALTEFHKRLERHSLAENASKYLVLLKGMKPIAGTEFRIKPVDAELLQSRYFGIEEVCRLYNVPPQLIGHTDKASSWASSIEQVNLFFLMYSLQPTFIRMESRIVKTLLTPLDRARGIRPKFAIQGLLRSDLKSRMMFYASALQNGYFNRDEVRDLEERGSIPGGDVYTIQQNMGGINDQGGGDGENGPKK